MPKPDTFCNYLPGGGHIGVCVLARIEELAKPRNGMWSQTEGPNISRNVRENNNIVTRNLTYVNLGRKPSPGGGGGSGSGGGTTGDTSISRTVLVSSHHTGPVTVSLQLLVDRDIFRHFGGDLSRYMYVTVHLGDLHDRWQQGGGIGTYAAVDAVAKTVTYNFTWPLRLDNIVLEEADAFPVGLTFSLRDNATLDFPITNQRIHFRQLVTENGKQVVDGNMSFAINIDSAGSASSNHRRTLATSAASSNYRVYPNPATNHLTIDYNGPEAVNSEITITDIVGRTVYANREQSMQLGNPLTISTSGFVPGVYLIKIRDINGATTYKVIKQ